ncbi:Uncharacterized protein FWK35_00036632, partial [Aphis craccivora]
LAILFADFPPNIWASASVILTRTSNACESFHSHFNKSFYTPHHQIYNFIYEILELQSEIYITINSIKLKTMEKIIQQYNENTIMRAEYQSHNIKNNFWRIVIVASSRFPLGNALMLNYYNKNNISIGRNFLRRNLYLKNTRRNLLHRNLYLKKGKRKLGPEIFDPLKKTRIGSAVLLSVPVAHAFHRTRGEK